MNKAVSFGYNKFLLKTYLYNSSSQFGIFFLSQHTVCPGSSDPPEKIFNMFASENEGYIIY